MARVIKVNRKHNLGKDEIRKTVDKLAEKLKKDLDAECAWEGSTLKFKRKGATGKVDVSDSEVNIEVQLGMLLGPLKGTIEKTIEEEIDKYLA
jgi:putative polyhydroxyalkanoate system protein